MRKARKDMVTLAARANRFNRVVRTPVEERKWCPGCNRTLTIDHFTPLSIGVPSYRPYCNQCTPFLSHRCNEMVSPTREKRRSIVKHLRAYWSRLSRNRDSTARCEKHTASMTSGGLKCLNSPVER